MIIKNENCRTKYTSTFNSNMKIFNFLILATLALGSIQVFGLFRNYSTPSVDIPVHYYHQPSFIQTYYEHSFYHNLLNSPSRERVKYEYENLDDDDDETDPIIVLILLLIALFIMTVSYSLYAALFAYSGVICICVLAVNVWLCWYAYENYRTVRHDVDEVKSAQFFLGLSGVTAASGLLAVFNPVVL